MRFILSLICLLTFTFTASAQKTLSLDGAIQTALNKNTTLQKTENTLKTYESGVKAAYGNFLPSLGAYGNWNWTKADEAGGTRYFQGTLIPVPSTSTQSRNYSIGASSDITLFDGLSNYATLSKSRNDLSRKTETRHCISDHQFVL